MNWLSQRTSQSIRPRRRAWLLPINEGMLNSPTSTIVDPNSIENGPRNSGSSSTIGGGSGVKYPLSGTQKAFLAM